MKIIAIITLLFSLTIANALFDLSSIQDTQLAPLLKGDWQQLLPASTQNVK